MIIDHGKIVAEGTPDELKRRVSGDVVLVEVTGDPERAKSALAELAGVREAAIDGTTVRLTVERATRRCPEFCVPWIPSASASRQSASTDPPWTMSS